MNAAEIRFHLGAESTLSLAALWERCANASAMLLALWHTGDRRLVARGALACLNEVAAFIPDQRAAALLAQFVAGGSVPPRERTATRDAVAAAAYPPGEVALAAMAVCAALELLDLDDPTPSVAAVAELAADALLDASAVATLAAARLQLADAIRRATQLPTQ